MLARTFGSVRVVFNDALRCRDEAYRAGQKVTPTEVQRRVITEAKTTSERAWLAEVASVALVQSVRDAHRAYQNFFDSAHGKRRGRKVGHPRFKSRKDTRQSLRLTRNGFALRPNGRLYLAKIGDVRVRWSRDLPSAPSGVDLGIARLATVATSDGRRLDIANPKHLARKLRKLARLERQKARRVTGGANRAKMRRKLVVQHGKVARARRDHLHKQALILVRENQAVHIEDLNVMGMVRNRRLARVILAAGQAERRNACGAGVSPSFWEAVGDEAGTTPDAA